ncbi:hypothetical protein yrohd0001_17620 [Yersinia rohdei ATCC 43380]|nr:hypothetical protein yrohd0001_17620 [Yersinia rohdei ATCC 43380]
MAYFPLINIFFSQILFSVKHCFQSNIVFSQILLSAKYCHQSGALNWSAFL